MLRLHDFNERWHPYQRVPNHPWAMLPGCSKGRCHSGQHAAFRLNRETCRDVSWCKMKRRNRMLEVWWISALGEKYGCLPLYMTVWCSKRLQNELRLLEFDLWWPCDDSVVLAGVTNSPWPPNWASTKKKVIACQSISDLTQLLFV